MTGDKGWILINKWTDQMPWKEMQASECSEPNKKMCNNLLQTNWQNHWPNHGEGTEGRRRCLSDTDLLRPQLNGELAVWAEHAGSGIKCIRRKGLQTTTGPWDGGALKKNSTAGQTLHTIKGRRALSWEPGGKGASLREKLKVRVKENQHGQDYEKRPRGDCGEISWIVKLPGFCIFAGWQEISQHVI